MGNNAENPDAVKFLSYPPTFKLLSGNTDLYPSNCLKLNVLNCDDFFDNSLSNISVLSFNSFHFYNVMKLVLLHRIIYHFVFVFVFSFLHNQ